MNIDASSAAAGPTSSNALIVTSGSTSAATETRPTSSMDAFNNMLQVSANGLDQIVCPTYSGLDNRTQRALAVTHQHLLQTSHAMTSMMVSTVMRQVHHTFEAHTQAVVKKTQKAIDKGVNSMRQDLHEARRVMEEDRAEDRRQFDSLKAKVDELKLQRHAESLGAELNAYSHKTQLRQVVAWILIVGPDTINHNHMAPIFKFDVVDDTHVTVISRSMLAVTLLMHRKKFTPNFTGNYTTKLRNMLTPYLYTNLNVADKKRLEGCFPQKPYRAGAGVFVVKTKLLVEWMKMEKKLMEQDRCVLTPNATFEMHTQVYHGGSLTCQGYGPDADFKDTMDLKERTANQTLKRPVVRALLSLTGKDMLDMAKKFNPLNIARRETLLDHMPWITQRVYWNLPASKEYLESEAFQQGVTFIRKEVFDLNTPADEVWHIGLWTEIDQKTRIKPLYKYFRNDECDLLCNAARKYHNESELQENKDEVSSGNGVRSDGKC